MKPPAHTPEDAFSAAVNLQVPFEPSHLRNQQQKQGLKEKDRRLLRPLSKIAEEEFTKVMEQAPMVYHA